MTWPQLVPCPAERQMRKNHHVLVFFFFLDSHRTHSETAKEPVFPKMSSFFPRRNLQLYSFNLWIHGCWTTSNIFFFLFSLFRILSLAFPLLQKGCAVVFSSFSHTTPPPQKKTTNKQNKTKPGDWQTEVESQVLVSGHNVVVYIFSSLCSTGSGSLESALQHAALRDLSIHLLWLRSNAPNNTPFLFYSTRLSLCWVAQQNYVPDDNDQSKLWS